MRRTAIVVAALAGALACNQKGGEDERCDVAGPLGPWQCDTGLICNDATWPPICQRPKSVWEGDPCSANELCAGDRWCDTATRRCRSFLKEGEPCNNPFSCGPNLQCRKDAARMTCWRPYFRDAGADGP